MLDVHPPHSAVHSWRDFLTHIATITIGLLIALALEAGVEEMHHRHIVREAREQIRDEVKENQVLLAQDLKYLDSNRETLRRDILLLSQIRQHPGVAPAGDIQFPWHWNSPSAAAWDTARNTGALTLMPYEDAHAFSLVYGQQRYVIDQATLYINHHHAAMMALSINPDVSKLSSLQLDRMIDGCATTITDIQYLEELMKGLDGNYASLLREM